MQETAMAAVQFQPDLGDVAANLDRISIHLDALPEDVSVAVFPELAVTGYSLEVAETHAESIPGPSTERLGEIAADYGIHVVAGLPERADSTLYNSLVYVSPEGFAAAYRKRRLWGEETEQFAEGSESVVVDTPVGSVGLLICYDLNFPEIALEYAADGVDVLAVSAAWRTDYLSDWRLLARARGLDTTSYVVGSNHIGDQKGRDHAGHSLIAGPGGTIQEEAGTEPGSVAGTISAAELTRARERNPVLSYRDSVEQ